jgi:hypothetical protein
MNYTKQPVGNTCPLIDSVISNNTLILKKIRSLEDILPPDLMEQLNFIIDYCDDIIIDSDKNLEEIREANSTLRSWGVANGELAEEFENKSDKLESTISNLEKDGDYKDDKICQLETVIESLQDKIEVFTENN